MKRLATFLMLLLSMAAFAAQVCYDDTARPAGNTGSGFYVLGSKLYDPTEIEFRIRGANHNHWDQTGANTGIPLMGANAMRLHLDFKQTATTNLKVVNGALSNGMVPIIGNWVGTCKADAASLSSIIDTWVAQAPIWTTFNKTALINIANEWGPVNSSVWRDSYIAAITRMRAAGYAGALVVDSGGCGQDVADLVNYGAAVLAADPQKNVLFDLHVYGNFAMLATTSWQQDFATSMAKLKATGLPIIIGEFGPGRNIGPSPTMLTPEQIVTAAENAGFGWLAWAYDDNNLAGCKTDDNWFGMVRYCATYTGKPTELTAFGLQMLPLFKKYGAMRANFATH